MRTYGFLPKYSFYDILHKRTNNPIDSVGFVKDNFHICSIIKDDKRIWLTARLIDDVYTYHHYTKTLEEAIIHKTNTENDQRGIFTDKT